MSKIFVKTNGSIEALDVTLRALPMCCGLRVELRDGGAVYEVMNAKFSVFAIKQQGYALDAVELDE
jgi:hypothetical protein